MVGPCCTMRWPWAGHAEGCNSHGRAMPQYPTAMVGPCWLHAWCMQGACGAHVGSMHGACRAHAHAMGGPCTCTAWAMQTPWALRASCMMFQDIPVKYNNYIK